MPEGQIIIHERGRIAKGTFLASERARELARIRWDKERAKKAEAEAWAASSGGQRGQTMPPPPSSAPPPPPSSGAMAAIRKTNPCANMIVRGGPNTWRGLPLVQAAGTPFGNYSEHQEKAAIEAALARRTRRR